jgi:LysM domain-containing protein
MRRRRVRLVAGALVALCLAGCSTGVAFAAGGGKTVAQAPPLKLGKTVRGQLYSGNFYSGFSAAYWTARFVKGDHISIRTKAGAGETPPCQILYMPGTDDNNVGATTPILDPDASSQTRHGSRDFQRWVTATETGTYVLAMTNADILLSGAHQCLDAAPGRSFAFKVTVAHRGSTGSAKQAKKSGQHQEGKGNSTGGGSTHVVTRGQSLWVIAQSLVDDPFSIADVAFKVDRLWQLNAARIGTGNRNLIFPGQQLRLR